MHEVSVTKETNLPVLHKTCYMNTVSIYTSHIDEFNFPHSYVQYQVNQ